MRRAPLVALLAATISWSAARATTITVVNNDGSAEGFNDATVVSPVGGNAGTTLGAQRLTAFTYAATLWAAELTSTVTIKVDATMDPLTCGPSSAVLGSAGTSTVHRDFANAPYANTYFPQALANKLAGSDQGANNDIHASFNSTIGTTCSFPRTWYYGLDHNPSGSQLDFVSVVLHELGHGLGFQTFVDLASGSRLNSRDDVFMKFLEDHSLGLGWSSMTDGQRAASAVDNGDLHWTGGNVVAAATFLTAGRHAASGHVQMYAPTTLAPGSSVAHWDTAVTPNEVMEPSYTTAIHDLSLARDLMSDIGWDNTTTTTSSTTSTTATTSTTVTTSTSTTTTSSSTTATTATTSSSSTSSTTATSSTTTSSSTTTTTSSTTSTSTTTASTTTASTTTIPTTTVTTSTTATTSSTSSSSTTSSTTTSSSTMTSSSTTATTSTTTTTSTSTTSVSTTTASTTTLTTSTTSSSTMTLPSTTSTTPTSSTTSSSIPSTTTTASTSSSTTTTTLPQQGATLCPSAPLATCRASASQRSTVLVRNASSDAKDVLKWKIVRGGQATLSDLKDLVAGGTALGVCLYDGSGSAQPLLAGTVLSGGTCNGRPCWKSLRGPGGYRYKDRIGDADGITDLKLRLTGAGELQLVVNGRGASLGIPRLPLTLPVTAQLVLTDAAGSACWQASFPSAIKNESSLFKANGH